MKSSFMKYSSNKYYLYRILNLFHVFQVRRHVYNFISDLCTVSTCTLPTPAHKTLAQQLNVCHHETSGVHYAALVTVLTSSYKVSYYLFEKINRYDMTVFNVVFLCRKSDSSYTRKTQIPFEITRKNM